MPWPAYALGGMLRNDTNGVYWVRAGGIIVVTVPPVAVGKAGGSEAAGGVKPDNETGANVDVPPGRQQLGRIAYVQWVGTPSEGTRGVIRLA